MKKNGSVPEKKSYFKMMGLTFSSTLDWGSCTISITTAPPRKLGCVSIKSTMRPCMEYCCHFWDGASSCYLEFLDKLQKRICRTVGLSLAASLEPLTHHRNMASLSLFYRY